MRSVPFQKIKIDQAFVKDLETSSETRSILKTIVDLANTLDMKTTAEGVETGEQHRIVQETGCTEMQGYLFQRPVPNSQLLPLLRKSTGKRAA